MNTTRRILSRPGSAHATTPATITTSHAATGSHTNAVSTTSGASTNRRTHLGGSRHSRCIRGS